MNFEYSFKQLEDISIINFKGDLIDKGQAAQMLYEIDKHIEKKENRFILDLENLKYMNSSGLNILINILTKSRKAGGDVALVHVSPKVNELLTITKLNSIFNMSISVESAANTLHKK